MSFVLTDEGRNKTLAVVSDGAVAQFLKHYYLGIGLKVRFHIHDAVICETVDEEETSLTYMFEI